MRSVKDKIIGVDIGGTKISIGIIVDGYIEQSVKLSTRAEGSLNEIVQRIIEGIESLDNFQEAIGIGVGAPGLVDENKGVIFSSTNISSWNEVYLSDYLGRHFKKPVFVTNDANCFALGIKAYGEGQNFTNLIGLSLGTGTGAGIVANNSLYSGVFAGAGEFGGLPYLDADFETYCSGKFFKSRYGIDGDEAYQKAINNDEKYLRIFDEFGVHVGNLIKTILFILAPEAIFIGGSVGKSFPLWEKAMWQVVDSFPYKKVIEKLVIKPITNPVMPTIGAAAFFQHRFENTEVEVARGNFPA